ncbi:MAG TPA: hydroxymethylglutaryl-CoA lyase [Deltaproteobacteria bacterium]|nr:hydroxymethylglutaryl-CoA lyase [Deltaproteobacteria bacterium]
MLNLPDQASVYEVGPRDGLQNEPSPVPTDVKVELVNRLSATGLPYIEVSSFVHPRWIPQLGDAEQVFEKITRRDGARYGALVPNMRGLARAREAQVETLAVFVSASETHNQKNLNRSIDESLANIEEVMGALSGHDLWVRGYVSMVFGCPYEGKIPTAAVARVATRLLELGIDQISLGDTVGFASPRLVRDRMAELAPDLPPDRVALHFHDTRGTALANIVAGLDAGVRTFDGAIGGLGGCPYAPGASGNVATEDLVQMFHSMGIETGIDLEALVDAAAFIEETLKKRLPSRYLRAARGTCNFS